MKKIIIILSFVFVLFFMNLNLIYGEEQKNSIVITKYAHNEQCAITDTCFIPSVLTVCVGTEVTWINNDVGPHIISSGKVIKGPAPETYAGKSDNEFQSKMIPSHGIYSHKFLKSGNYEYFSFYYLHATGKIIVNNSCDGIYIHALKTISPLKQFQSGIAVADIRCKENLHLIINSNDGYPACVKTETKLKLMMRGWTVLQEHTASIMLPTITIPRGISDPIPKVSMDSAVVVVKLGVNDTISWLNNDTTSLTIVADDKSWSSGIIELGESTQVKFNQTGFYPYRVDTTWATGNVIVLGDDVDSLDLEVKLKMAQALLSKEMHVGSPLWGLGIGTPDNVLEIDILEDELERIPNAKEYYEKMYTGMIPFNVPVRIEFGPQPHPLVQK